MLSGISMCYITFWQAIPKDRTQLLYRELKEGAIKRRLFGEYSWCMNVYQEIRFNNYKGPSSLRDLKGPRGKSTTAADKKLELCILNNLP